VVSPTDSQWELQVRPHMTSYFAYIAAVIVAAGLIAVGFLLKIRSTGVFFHTSDQVAMAGLGIVIAAVILLLTRPRLRVGRSGVSVRNLFGDRLIAWSEVVDVSFPRGARWARVDLPDDEYIPVMAIQAVDRQRAVQAMDAVRALMARYRPACGSAGPSPGV
jgi:hypothetical protein